MAEKSDPKTWQKETLAVHAGGLKNPVFGEVSPPIFQTSTFSFPSAEAGAARFSGAAGLCLHPHEQPHC